MSRLDLNISEIPYYIDVSSKEPISICLITFRNIFQSFPKASDIIYERPRFSK